MAVPIIVSGTRTFADYELLCAWLDVMQVSYGRIQIISGGATGADALAERYAKECNVPIKVIKADWAKHGRAAGPLRNKYMASIGQVLVAFWDGKSRGTANMIEEATTAGLKVHVVHY